MACKIDAELFAHLPFEAVERLMGEHRGLARVAFDVGGRKKVLGPVAEKAHVVHAQNALAL